MGYVRLKPRKMPVRRDEKAGKKFIKQVQIFRVQTKVDLWFCDETGFTGDPVPRQIMCLKGTRPTIPYYGSHIRTSAVGATRPKDGKFISLLLPFVNSEVFQYFLNELKEAADKRKRNLVILDNASWHKTLKLNWGILEPIYLPAYSPDLNPIEELWLAIKREFFTWFWTNKEEILDKQVEMALKYYIDRPDLVKSICSMSNYD